MSAGVEPHPEVILASASASRAALLHGAGLDFTVQPARVDEDEIKIGMRAEGQSAAVIAEALANLKAVKVSSREPEALVIGADQILECDGEMFDKPADMMAARAQLMKLRGKPHRLISAAVVARGGAAIWRHSETATLAVRAFSDGFLDDYLATVGAAVLKSVGAYQLEGPGVQLFDRVDGDYFTVLGLPLLPLLGFLRDHRVIVP